MKEFISDLLSVIISLIMVLVGFGTTILIIMALIKYLFL